MIAILVHNPNYAASTELVKAFSLVGPTELISLERGHEVYQRDPGHLIGQEFDACLEIVQRADLVVFGDATSFQTMASLWPIEDLGSLLHGKKALALLADTEYITKPDKYADLCDAYGIRLFTLPGYRPLNMQAIPFHHPFEWDGEVVKGERILVVHSPAQENKRRMKGSNQIERAVGEVMGHNGNFTYRREMGLPYAEVIEKKSHAHIFIDQFTPEATLPCVGRNGCEGMSLGCVTLSSIYQPEMVEGYFNMPPVIPLTGQEQMQVALEQLIHMQASELVSMGREGADWAKWNISYREFIRYILRHL